MRDVSDQYIGAFALFVMRMSTYIEQEAKKYGFKYLVMDKELFGDVTEDVMKSLGLSVNYQSLHLTCGMWRVSPLSF